MKSIQPKPNRIEILTQIVYPKDPQEILDNLKIALERTEYSIRRQDRLKLTHQLKITLNIDNIGLSFLGYIQSNLEKTSSKTYIHLLDVNEFPKKHPDLHIPKKKSVLFLVTNDSQTQVGYGYFNQKYLSLVWVESETVQSLTA